MQETNAEAFIRSVDPTSVSRKIEEKVKPLCSSVFHGGCATFYSFSSGKAAIKNANNGIIVWISAQNIVDFYGIMTVLSGYIAFAISTLTEIHWQPANGSPFQEIVKIRKELKIEIDSNSLEGLCKSKIRCLTLEYIADHNA